MVKIKCDGCGEVKRSRGIIWINNKHLCYSCRIKRKMILGFERGIHQKKLGEAQKEVRDVCWTAYPKSLHCQVNVPPCYFGKKVRVIVVEDGE